MNYYKFHIGDYRRDTAHLSLIEHGIYRQLLDTYYLDEKPIETQPVIRRLSIKTEEEKTALNNVIDDFFIVSECGEYISHRRVDGEIVKYKAQATTSKENGKRGGRPKKQQVTESDNPAITQQVNLANPEITKGKPNHQPLTKNQKPLTKDKTLVPQAGRHTESISRIFAHWQTVMNHPRAHLDDKRMKIIRNALKTGYAEPDLIQAIDGCAKTAHNMGQNDAGTPYDGLHIIFKDADNIDRFLKNNLINPQVSKNENSQRDSRSRAKRVADKLADIARRDIEENGATEIFG